MKVSNETKIGALTAISITLLIIGFNLLNGKSLFRSGEKTIYAVYTNVDGLSAADAVQVSGLTVGSVSGLEVMDRNVGRILVRLSIKKDINIPVNSIASIISADLLGTKAVRIDFGNSGEFLKSGDTIYSQVEGSLTDKLMSSIQPITIRLQATLTRLDSVLSSMYETFDPATRNNLRSAIAGLNTTMQSFSRSSARAGHLIGNLDSLSELLKNNSSGMAAIVENTRKATNAFANGSLDTMMKHLASAMVSMDDILQGIKQSRGSLGKLVYDKALYDNLEAATLNFNRLMEDLRLNPKRYVHFSVFGKKQMPAPIPPDSLSSQ